MPIKCEKDISHVDNVQKSGGGFITYSDLQKQEMRSHALRPSFCKSFRDEYDFRSANGVLFGEEIS